MQHPGSLTFCSGLLAVLQANSSLTSLNLHGCKRISDKGLNAVSNLPLKALSLGLTRVKDEGMAYLARLTQLTELHCTNEELTDEGIHHLSSLTDLNTLALRDCCEVSGDALLVRRSTEGQMMLHISKHACLVAVLQPITQH